jgi:hypothetical protein
MQLAASFSPVGMNICPQVLNMATSANSLLTFSSSFSGIKMHNGLVSAGSDKDVII